MVVSRLLFAKLVARKPKNGESMTFQLLMQCIQFCKKKKKKEGCQDYGVDYFRIAGDPDNQI